MEKLGQLLRGAKEESERLEQHHDDCRRARPVHDGDDFNKVGAAIATSEPLSVEQFEALFGNPVPHNRAPQMSH
jgi:hypothetical protein